MTRSILQLVAWLCAALAVLPCPVLAASRTAPPAWLSDFKESLQADAADRVMQFLVDPNAPDQAWMLTEQNLQYNPGLKSQGQWRIRFNRETFEGLTKTRVGDVYRQRRIQFSSTKRGTLYLLVEASSPGGDIRPYIFRTSDNGDTWRFTALKGKQRGSKPSAAAKDDEEAVDLDALNIDAPSSRKGPPSAASGAERYQGVNTQPIFKVLFDLLLWVRPGLQPLSFDNYHTLLLVDFLPKPELQFSFEVSPNPRYYELTYKPTPSLAIRAGRIYIPFDQMSPHNSFGGLINTSRVRPPGNDLFLPDIWTDLGVAVRWQIANSPGFTLDSHAYVVNGFGAGTPDPAGEVGNLYPTFSTVSLLDNNGDKALGGRLHARLFGFLGLGASVYTGRYTNDGDPSARITMVGTDAQLRFPFGLEIRGGFINMNVGLVPPSTVPDFRRNGYYAEVSQRLGDRFRLVARGGSSQNDDRITQTNDVTLVGGGLVYDMGMFQFSLQHFRDLQEIPGKATNEFSALRALVLF